MGKVAAFFAGVLVFDGAIVLFVSPGNGTGLAVGMLIMGILLAGVATGRLIRVPGESWIAWGFGLLGAAIATVFYALNVFLSLVGMGSRDAWDKQTKTANTRKAAVAKAATAANTKSYDASGDFAGQSIGGKFYNASGDYTGQIVDGKFYDSAGDYTGQMIDGKFYDTAGDYTGQVIDGRHYDAAGDFVGQVMEA